MRNLIGDDIAPEGGIWSLILGLMRLPCPVPCPVPSPGQPPYPPPNTPPFSVLFPRLRLPVLYPYYRLTGNE